MSVPYTTFKYLDIPSPTKIVTKILDKQIIDSTYWVVPAETVVHIKGGGQPSDEGYINGQLILDMRIQSKMVYMQVSSSLYNQLNLGDEVTLSVNEALRAQNAKLHTSGHVLADVLQHIMGKDQYLVTKCNHNKGQSCISFEEFPDFSLEDIQNAYDTYVQRILHMTPISKVTDQEVASGKPSRLLTIGDYLCPCGGTHVKDLREIIDLKVLKIKKRSGEVRVRYQI